MDHKEKFIMSMIESTNICYRQIAVENKMDLIELEKQILAQEPTYRYIYEFAYKTLIKQGILTKER